MKFMLEPFGQTRTQLHRSHAFLAPDGHVKTQLPGWTQTEAVILVSPQIGARHSMSLVFLQIGASSALPLAGTERFVLVLSGRLTVKLEAEVRQLSTSDFVFLPADTPHTLSSQEVCQLLVYERRHIPLDAVEKPPIIFGNEQSIAGEAFMGDPAVIAKKLLPDDPRFDMAVNTMNFEPGASLPFAESHFMEHGMLMLRGGGIYRLGEHWYPIREGDALWMGPFCPQWFGALGKVPSSYVLYKEANRDVFQFERES